MISVESWPARVARIWTLTQRFQKFATVGVVGLGVSQLGLLLFHEFLGIQVKPASAVAISLSMIFTFFLNEAWTWRDRGTGRVVSRAMSYIPINTGGILINWAILNYLLDRFSVHYLLANIIGAAAAAAWNFSLNNKITWRS